ncbi:hypothetical protein [Streptococcus sp. NLN64]|uniref:hypothetical protein n=1 Tax=Streptococcus sp. NLN64 TaxID=2822799 RepID=UPI0018C8F19B|nr:hypothetical protein [Streptococcus sp. NLN64]MBG9366549.1 hypothetical protein [Streptococcus sp. NLN64]
MNKRIKKKREFEDRLLAAEMHIGYLLDQNKQLWSVIEQNARSTNKEFKKLGQELLKFNKQAKKSLFKRR